METTISGVKTNYIVMGEGAPFIVLHGWGSNTERWLEVAKPLAQKFKVIIPDLPGFGNSEALSESWTANKYISWLENFVKELNLGDLYLMGHSFGGALAVKFAIKHPQQVKKLFLVSAAFVRKRTIKKQVLGRISKAIKIFSFLPFYPFARKAFYKFVVGSDDYLKAQGTMKNTFLNVTDDDLSQFVAFVRVPTVIIWGNKDDATLVDDAYFLNKKIKNSKLIIIEEGVHSLHIKQPKILAQKVLENI